MSKLHLYRLVLTLSTIDIHIVSGVEILVPIPSMSPFHVPPPPPFRAQFHMASSKVAIMWCNNTSRILQCLGQAGRVTKRCPTEDIQVSINGKRWIFNPNCLVPTPHVDLPNNAGWFIMIILHSIQLRTYWCIVGLSDSRDSVHYRDSTAHYSNTIITFPVFVRRVGTSKRLGTSHRVFTAHAY